MTCRHTDILEKTPEETKMECDWKQIIAHVDMDAFFAQIEERDHPQFRGKPVIVGGMPGQRGVASTCNYEARKYGVHAGMPLTECQRLCPQAIYVRTYGGKYAFVSLQVLSALQGITDEVEMASIDEAYLDLSHHRKRFSSLENIGEVIKKSVWDKVKLTCSIGIAPNRYIAKLCAGEHKPDGLTVMSVEQYQQAFAPKKVSALIGVGESTEKALNSLGIYTISQLQKFPAKILETHFGVNGPRLKEMANGEYEHSIARPYALQPEDKSAGHETTFEEDITERELLDATILHLSSKVARRLREKQYIGKRVTVKIRYADFTTFTHQTTLDYFSADEEEIFRTAVKCFNEAYVQGKAVRLIGVRMSQMKKTADSYTTYQSDLFTGIRSAKKHRALQAADHIRERFGEQALFYVGVMHKS